MARTSVDFPPPLGPVMRTRSPARIVKVMSRNASASAPLKPIDHDENETRRRDMI
jgi:hypothetical protein